MRVYKPLSDADLDAIELALSDRDGPSYQQCVDMYWHCRRANALATAAHRLFVSCETHDASELKVALAAYLGEGPNSPEDE
jgi:hypothetical protein